MRTSSLHPAPEESGFILIGVVTFMLALTILGLSLFALSSYEGQFFGASAAREQSMQDAQSGMELVQALLAAPSSRLEAAHLAEGQFGITHAMAYQKRSALDTDTTSSGPVNWDSTMVIVVAARRGGVERTLRARFLPTPAQNPYQRLMAAGGGITCNLDNGTGANQFHVAGAVWQPVASSADTAWTNDITWDSGRPLQRGTPPFPQADAFVDAHAGTAVPIASDFSNNNNYQLTLAGSPASMYFFPPADKPTERNEDKDFPTLFNDYSFFSGTDVTIQVGGVAVWLVPDGVLFKDRVFVKSTTGAMSTLIIVAKATSDPDHAGRAILFNGGLTIPNHDVQVFLVSEHDISVIHHTDHNRTNDASAVSIVAGGRIEIGGPDNSESFRLAYDPAMDGPADQLLADGKLPPLPVVIAARFALARPSWTEITPH